MQTAIDETTRRREKQLAYNLEHNITPESIQKAIRRGIEEEVQARQLVRKTSGTGNEQAFVSQSLLKDLEGEMLSAAEALDFEKAAEIRDRIRALKNEDGTESPTDISETNRGARPRRSRGKGRVPRPKRP